MNCESTGLHPEWSYQAVLYEMNVRQLTPEGTLRAAAAKLPFLKDLGVDAVWLMPVYPIGEAERKGSLGSYYSIRDYCAVNPELGTMADFDAFVTEAHRLGMKVLLDWVANHTARDARWIAEEHASWYERDASGQPAVPWDWSDTAKLNYANRAVWQGQIDAMRFWLAEHGVDGFRIDVAHGLAKDLDRDDLDDYVVMSTNDMPADGSHPVLDRDEVHDIYREWRREVFNRYDPPRFAVAEAWVRPERQYLYASPDELGQVFNFEFAKADWTFDAMSKAIDEGLACAERSGSTSTWVMSNHDVPRHATRYALPQVPTGEYHQIANDWLLRDGTTYIEDRRAGALRARAALMLEMALPGSAYVYQGEELGLFEVADIPWDRIEDPSGLRTSRAQSTKGRDGCRVPLPWVASDVPETYTSDKRHVQAGSFGFSPAVSDAEPHLPQPAWFKDFAMDIQDADDGSMLNFYRRVLRLRHEMQTPDTSCTLLPENRPSGMRDGADGQPGGVIAYRRANGWANLTNFGATPVSLPDGEVLLSSAPLTDDGRLPQDTSVWMRLR